MLKDINLRSIKNGCNYIAECEVLDTETNKKFYVVSQLGNLFYNTYDSSYIDYVLGKTKIEPIKIEGEDYMWFDYNTNRGFTRFWEEYRKTCDEACSLQYKDYINHKYPHLKKPIGNIKYKVLNKKSKPVFGCGPMGDIYEIEFLILSDNSHLFVYSDDEFGAFSINDYSVYDTVEKEQNGEKVEYKETIEEISCFAKAKKSKYYDLYLEMEKFKDNYEM